ncbi:hypothetical protein CEXT_384991 [Caerostris extrusa]|uniref:Uncharacterized protein n=1 Tax=Caerostris extrusa TaxID=172846 RepID=A0AAV4M5Q8_CAEEX|nr:hypothetical protein CEXT_384991 [Caerostris extrusa]
MIHGEDGIGLLDKNNKTTPANPSFLEKMTSLFTFTETHLLNIFFDGFQISRMWHDRIHGQVYIFQRAPFFPTPIRYISLYVSTKPSAEVHPIFLKENRKAQIQSGYHTQ